MQAEAAAREFGCRGIYLDTFTFQAPALTRLIREKPPSLAPTAS
jgi:hypothetical protein